MSNIIVKISVYIGLILLFNGNLEQNFNKNFGSSNTDSYKEMWEKVKNFDSKGLPKSALEVVESIYISALAEKNTEQIIKSTAYRIKYITHLEEEGYILAIEQLENDLQNMPNEAKYFSHALLAEMYSSYLKDNYYQISQRTRLMDFVPDDKETWDENLFKAKIIEHYKLALNEELKNMPVEKYPELISYDKLALEFKLTVYDLFSEMAFTKFTETYSSFWYYRLAQHAGFPANPKFCANANEFLKINYEQTDTTDFNYHAYVVMRNWVDYRLSEPNEVSALVYTDLMRLNYYRENTENSKFDAEWLKSLEELRSKYKNTKALIDINYSLGKYYIAQGSNYSFNQANTEVYADYNRKAWNLFDEVVTNIKDTAIIGKCLNAKASIESKELSFLSKDINLVKKPIQVQIQYKNIEKLNISILQIDYQDYKTIESRYYSGEQLVNALQKKSKLINTIKIDLGGETDFNKHAADYFLQELPMGFYVLIAHTDEDFAEKDQVSAYTTTTVSNLAYTSSNNADGTWQILVADAITGVPIKNVEIILYKTVYNYSKSKYERKVLSILKTDNTGLAIYSSDKDDYSNFYVEIKTKNEIIPIQESAYLYQVYNANKNYEKVHFFTDRAIYRPGQTINFKGINIKVDNSMPKLLKTQKLSIGLYDANNQKVTSVSVQANMFGSFSGSFDIPHGALNGYYTIKCPYGNKGISVEEYKRPKFETSFKAIEDEYRIGDEVNIKGNVNTYAGSQISGAKVSYTVSRIVSWRGWPYFYIDIPKKQITHGECVSNEKGEFEIKFKTEFDGEIPNQGNAVFQYEIDIVVTDINGETQVNSTIVSASKNALFLTDNFPNILNSEQFDTLQVIAYNNNYKEIDANVIVEIYEVIDPKTLLSKNLFGKTDRKFYTQEEWYNQKTDIEYDDETNIESWEIGKKVFESSLNTGESTKLSIGKEIQKLNSGLYRLKLKTTDKFGTKVEHINQFALYSSNSKTMPYTTPAMFFQEKFRALPGENAVLYVGSSFKNVKYLIEIERNGKLIKREWKSLSNELQKIEIPVSEEDRGSFKVNFIFIKNAGIYNKQFTVYVPWNNKNLHLKLETFRNKIEPGSNEEWKLKLVDNDGNPAYAEVLAGMYDASLDVFAANNWSLSLYPDFFFHKYWTTSFLKIKTGKSIFRFSQKYFTEKAHYMNLRTFGALNPNSYSYFVERGQYKAEILLEAEEAPDMTDSEPTGAAGMLTDRKSSTSVMSLQDKIVDKEEVSAIDIRTNFNETAFFYPHLITDKNGVVSINFKAPESLTRWNLMALAHTEDLKYGDLLETVITAKDLMLMPNIPRFVREQDNLIFSAKIDNMLEETVKGAANIKFFDALSMKDITNEILQNDASKKNFEIAKLGNTQVSWNVKIPLGLSGIVYRITAETENHSDGEEQIIPVLPNRMLVTESMPMAIRGVQSKNFNFTRFLNSHKSSSLSHHKLNLEFTANPAWYAVQALPYLIENPNECAEQVFSRFYANSLASHIANSDKKIRHVFNLWRDLPDSEALISNLEKNQDLKAVMLEETPWVMQAQNETERKRRIGLLFDVSRMSNQTNAAINKLEQMQISSGGWPWFEGMPEDIYISQYILAGMGQLNKIGVVDIENNPQLQNIVKNAIKFVDAKLVKEYKELKDLYKKMKLDMDTYSPSYLVIQYLYARSFFIETHPISKNTKEAFDFYYGQSEKFWLHKSYYMKGMLALNFKRYGNEKLANDVIKSLEEFSLQSEEMGMFWKLKSGWFWYELPIETQAILIEAFDEVANDQESVEEMQIWLLKQKQTQDWKTSTATANAIYALLLKGTDLLATENLVKIQIGNENINLADNKLFKTEPGTGYFQKAWTSSEIKPNMGNVKVEKQNKGIAWGALYWQYYENLDKITAFNNTPLKIKKQLFVEKNENGIKVMAPVSDKHKLQLGDIVKVRIEVKVDRDMEYVHLKDMRAACFEPTEVFSGYRWSAGFGYYQSIKDASVNFFISRLSKGTYVFEYSLIVSQKGEFSNGITSIQSMYAPEFTSHSQGIRVIVE